MNPLDAARHPHYGGSLHVDMRASLKSLDPADTTDDAAASTAPAQVIPMVFETLVRLDQHGDPQPWLATAWAHDEEHRCWVFTPRQNVTFHDGSKWSPPDNLIAVSDERPINKILRDLARSRNAIVQRAPDGALLGTGPFRIAEWEAGKSLRLVAHDAYWGGRSFLDSVTIQMGRSLSEQATDFQIGKADAVEIAARDLRAPRPNGVAVFSTRPMETLALWFEPGRVPDTVREALALSIDRTAIRDVLLQKQGEISGALLPGWLTGYSFLFPSERNLARARQIAPAGAALAFAYDRQDAVIRPIAERLAVNASEAGIKLRTASQAPVVRLVRLPITSVDSWTALADIASLLRTTLPENPANCYEAEKALLGKFQVVPIIQILQAWMLSSRVKNWPNWADIWLDPGATQ